jgi:hypothetical protein
VDCVKEAYHPSIARRPKEFTPCAAPLPGGAGWWGSRDAGEVRARPLHGHGRKLSGTPAAALLLGASVSGALRACVRQRDHPLYLPVRAVDPRTVRTRAASVHEAIVSRIGVLFCMASRRVSAGVIDRGPAPCSRKHVCSCREKTRRPCRIPLAYVAHFFLRTLLCGELTRWRPPGVLRLDLEATHRDRLFSATLAGTQTARATTLRTREKIKGNTEPL